MFPTGPLVTWPVFVAELLGKTLWVGVYPPCFGRDERAAAMPGRVETGPARAGRVAAARAWSGPAVRRMQSKSDATSAPFIKSSKNCTPEIYTH